MVRINYNFHPQDLPDWSPASVARLFNERRRDAIFAYGEQNGRFINLIRDHLGTIPLYWRFNGTDIQLATNLADILHPTDTLSSMGIRTFLSFSSAKIVPLFNEINLVPPGTAVSIDTQTGTVQTIYQHQFKPTDISKTASRQSMAEEGERKFAQAIKRQLHADTVGLFLSGGIDSALIGIHLKKAGIQVNGYTAALWGKSSSELPFAKINAEKIGVDKHFIAYLESKHYSDSFQAIPRFYKTPHGSTASLGVHHLWQSGQLAEESQLFFGQNSDTMCCSVGQQFHTFFLNQLPLFMRRQLKARRSQLKMLHYLQEKTAVGNYISLVSSGLMPSEQHLPFIERWNGRSLHDLTLAGMLIGHTPSDGEVIIQPALNQNQRVSNPYYDVDLIEFCMGLPLSHRVGITEESKIKIGLKKYLFQDIAANYLPKALVNRKKAFTVSMSRDQRTKQLADSFPTTFGAIPLLNIEQQFGAAILNKFCHAHNLIDINRCDS